MKSLVAALSLLSLFPLSALAQATPPSLSTVDAWIQLAETVPTRTLEGTGKYSCSSPFQQKSQIVGSDDDLKKAQGKYLLKCIRSECAQLDGRIREAAKELTSASDEEVADLMHANEFSKEQINKVLADRKITSEPQFAKVTCANATPRGRYFVVDSCFTYPISCTKQ